ncbi:hypothetical protein [Streptomyces sp. NPDC004291]
MNAPSPAEGPEPPATIRQDARAQGQGQVYQVAHGNQKIVHHHHHGAARPAVPYNLPELRVWIERLTADYRLLLAARGELPRGRREAAQDRKTLEALGADLAGNPGRRDGKDQVRRLLAAGAAQYLSRGGPVPAGTLPEAVMVDLVVFALWPVVQSPGLPEGWHDHLAELTTPRLAAFTAAARDAVRRGRTVTPEEFGRHVADKPFARAVLALLEDLDDPRRGGAALTALSLAAHHAPPPQKAGGKVLLGWLLSGAAGAAVGGTAVGVADLTEDVWHRLHSTTRDTPSGAPGSSDVDQEDLEQHRGGGSRGSYAPGHPPTGGTGTATDFLDDLLS